MNFRAQELTEKEASPKERHLRAKNKEKVSGNSCSKATWLDTKKVAILHAMLDSFLEASRRFAKKFDDDKKMCGYRSVLNSLHFRNAMEQRKMFQWTMSLHLV